MSGRRACHEFLVVVAAALAGLLAVGPPAAADRTFSTRFSTNDTGNIAFAALADKIKSIGSSVKSGRPDAWPLSSADGDITSVSGLASAAGISVPAQIPSAAQLAAGGTS